MAKGKAIAEKNAGKVEAVQEQCLYIFYRQEERTLTQRARKMDPSGLKLGHYIIKQENDRIVIEQDKMTVNGEVVSHHKGKYVKEKKKDGTIVLSPTKDLVDFMIEKGKKGIKTIQMANTVKRFLKENGENGIYGLFATGERLTIEKMH